MRNFGRFAGFRVGAGLSRLGPELITNGDFAITGPWFPQAPWSIAGGVLSATALTAIACYQATTIKPGHLYDVTFTVTSISAGSTYLVIGTGANTAAAVAPGTYRQRIRAGSSVNVAVNGTGFTGSVDNVSVREVLG